MMDLRSQCIAVRSPDKTNSFGATTFQNFSERDFNFLCSHRDRTSQDGSAMVGVRKKNYAVQLKSRANSGVI